MVAKFGLGPGCEFCDEMSLGNAKRTAPKGRPFSAHGGELGYAALVEGVAAGAGLRAPTIFTGRGSALRAPNNSALA